METKQSANYFLMRKRTMLGEQSALSFIIENHQIFALNVQL